MSGVSWVMGSGLNFKFSGSGPVEERKEAVSCRVLEIFTFAVIEGRLFA